MVADAKDLVNCQVERKVECASVATRAKASLTAHRLTDLIKFNTGKVDAGWAARNLD